MFTFEPTNRCIASLELDDSNIEKLVYLDREDEVDKDLYNNKDMKFEFIRECMKELKKNKHLTRKEEDQLTIAAEENYPPRTGRLKDLYEELKQIMYREEGKDLYGKKAKFIPLFLPQKKEKQMHVVNIVGQSGSGKSHFANQCLQRVVEFFPESKIFIFSRKDEDEELEKQIEDNIIRIMCDESFLEEPLQIEDLKGTDKCPNYLVFDDYEKIANPNVRKAVQEFLSAAVEIGRQLNCHILIIRHELLTGIKTRSLLSEATGITIYPNGSPLSQVEDVLEKKMGLNTAQTKRIINLPSRWVYVSKTRPMHVIYEKGMYIL